MEETRYFELEEPGGHGRVASMAKQADERMVKRLFEAIGIEEIDIDGKTDDEVYDLLETARGYDTPGAHIKADLLIAEILAGLGLEKTAQLFRSMPKWFE